MTSTRRNPDQLREAFHAVGASLKLTPGALTARCTTLAVSEGKVPSALTASQWLRLAEKVAEQQALQDGASIPCDRCQGAGSVRIGGKVRWCMRCKGKGRQTAVDQERNKRYDQRQADKLVDPDGPPPREAR